MLLWNKHRYSGDNIRHVPHKLLGHHKVYLPLFVWHCSRPPHSQVYWWKGGNKLYLHLPCVHIKHWLYWSLYRLGKQLISGCSRIRTQLLWCLESMVNSIVNYRWPIYINVSNKIWTVWNKKIRYSWTPGLFVLYFMCEFLWHEIRRIPTLATTYIVNIPNLTKTNVYGLALLWSMRVTKQKPVYQIFKTTLSVVNWNMLIFTTKLWKRDLSWLARWVGIPYFLIGQLFFSQSTSLRPLWSSWQIIDLRSASCF